ncbi:chitin-binding protein [Paenibacillus sp. 1011MAR3C5]|uniref:lytic polysaccharide monooxygenase n=1 Tax=Paenibacillus sp. 1011MAR3C5 TaxID=1675787 RepID=UPI000E6CA557|nr:lytic polysaccharide monooxygenase [Paenibacillus sp. 1011MAR3C5]RJE90123.1 chitin-binding protein [Paenibacillus sp. 1011MAR3C5]
MTLLQNPRQLFVKALLASGFALVLVAIMTIMADRVSAHGYVESPASRAIQCKNGLNTDCGAIVYEPQSLEAPKGFPAAGPADGKIASAGGAFPKLDEQSSTRWSKVALSGGQQTFTWKFTANHASTSFRYFITKANWNPNSPLTRDQFESTPFCTVNYGGAQPPFSYSHTCNVPTDRSGYHVILAVWDVDNTANAFYNVIDVNLSGTSNGDTTAPTAPSNLSVSNVAATSATVSWSASADNVGVAGYRIFNGATQIGSTTGALTYNLTGLSANTAYNITVKAYDAAGNVSAASSAATFTTPNISGPDTAAPTAPGSLHVMGSATQNSVPLMWNASTDNVGVTGYQIFRGTTLVATVSGSTLEYLVTGLSANTAYTFTVKAVDAAGNVSAASNAVNVTTPSAPTTFPAWSSTQVYLGGDKVTYNGVNYEARWWTLGNIPGTPAGDVWKVIP